MTSDLSRHSARRISLSPETVMLGGRLGGAGLNLLSVVLAARVVGFEEYGIYGLALAVLALGVTGCCTWNRQAYVRNFYLARKDAQSAELAGFASKSILGSLLPATILVWVALGQMVPSASRTTAVALVFLTAAKAVFDLTIDSERIAERFWSSAARSIARPCVFMAILCILSEPTADHLLLALATAFFVTGIGPVIRLFREGSGTWGAESFPTRELLVLWMPATVGLAVEAINHNCGRFFVGWDHGLELSGQYSFASDLVRQGSGTFLLVLAGLQIQRLQKLEAGGVFSRRSLDTMLRNSVLVIAILLVGCVTLLPIVFRVVMPSALIGQDRVFCWLVVAAAFVSSGKIYVLDGLLVLFDRQKTVLRSSLLILGASLLLLNALVPLGGVRGAALAMLLAYSVGAVSSLIGVLLARNNLKSGSGSDQGQLETFSNSPTPESEMELATGA